MKEKNRLAYFEPRTAHYQSRHKFVASTIRHNFEHFFCFDYLVLSLTQEQQRFRLHEHYLTPDLARLTHAYMHVSCESDFDSFESNNLQFILACVVRL